MIYVSLQISFVKQGRKSMFKHGGDNIGEKYTSRLRDVFVALRAAPFQGGLGACPPEKCFLNGAIWCVLVYIWIRFCLKKISKIIILYIIFFKLSFFFIKNSKIIIFYIKSKYFRYTLASYGVILLKICLEAFQD